jgi:hypothetical protein
MGIEKKTVIEMTEIDIEIEGLSDILFDKFFDHSKNERPPEKKFYTDPDGDGKTVCLPSENLWSFLFAELNQGCARRFEGKKSKEYLSYGQSHVAIKPDFIPFTENGKQVQFDKFGKKFRIFQQSAPTKLSGGGMIKQEAKKRALVKLPWELKFNIVVFKNDRVTSEKLLEWFNKGGILIGLGTYRPRFGRFMVKKWDIK